MSKEKHLDYIQAVITRHNSNSFMLKGWTITLLSALLALSGAIKEPSICLIALLPVFVFWGLDSFYLSNERCFVDLYNAVINGYTIPKTATLKKKFVESDENSKKGQIQDLSMSFSLFKIWKDNQWLSVLKSKTIFWFYFPLTLITLSIWLFLSSYFIQQTKPLQIDGNIKLNQLEIKTNPPTIINNVYTGKADTLKK